MKKKIKDLTLEDVIFICQKNECKTCPLNIRLQICLLDVIELNFLEKKVEVDLSEEEN